MHDPDRTLRLVHEAAALAARLSAAALAADEPAAQRRLFAVWARAQDRYLRRCARATGRAATPAPPARAVAPPAPPAPPTPRRIAPAAPGRVVRPRTAFA